MILSQNQICPETVLILDEKGVTTHKQLENDVLSMAEHIRELPLPPQSRIGIYIQPSADFVVALLGIWYCNHIAVPFCLSHPVQELQYIISDADISVVITTEEMNHDQFRQMNPSISLIFSVRGFASDKKYIAPLVLNDALMIYTSGTTSRPKGVVLSHANLRAQLASLSPAWEWSKKDVILNVLPLHHVHGLINILYCALGNGAVCEFHSKFDAVSVWEWFGKVWSAGRRPSLFMAVPTIYSRLIRQWEDAETELKSKWSASAAALRLMVSGSAALPESVLWKWEQITGHRLLERYGMTEIGMALSNPLYGSRKPGYVGKPLPGVAVRLHTDQGLKNAPGIQGELQIKSENVFREYWKKPEVTASSFTEDGWFKTGDIAVMDEEGDYKLLGRASQDIIKTGGYKVSALEIEAALLETEEVAECAVVGLIDEEWGERVAAIVVLNIECTESELKSKLKNKLASYKIPSRWRFVTSLPRNTMGKVMKPELKKLFH